MGTIFLKYIKCRIFNYINDFILGTPLGVPLYYGGIL